MTRDRLDPVDRAGAGVAMAPTIGERGLVHGRYRAECRDKDGNLRWVEEFDNVVTTPAKNAILDIWLGNAATNPGAVVMGLKGTGTAAAADTQASHAGWLEVGLANLPTYSGNRPTPSFSAASAGAKATSSAVSFAITGTGTVAGCFLNLGGSATKDNTTGTLLSAGDFSNSRSVFSGDTITVTYTLSI